MEEIGTSYGFGRNGRASARAFGLAGTLLRGLLAVLKPC